jgi:hypothetical protein
MLDVHPPHEAAHSWKDFFIHIATIVIGLIIAVGLEQAVEAIHHRHQLSESRESLRVEREQNHKNFAANTAIFREMAALAQNDLLVLHYLQQHPGTPEEKLPGVLKYRSAHYSMENAAWKTAQRTNVTEFMPREEVTVHEAVYQHFSIINDGATDVWIASSKAGQFNSWDPDLSHLTPALIDEQIKLTQDYLTAIFRWGVELLNLNGDFPDFTQAPTISELLALRGATRTPQDVQKLQPAQQQTDARVNPLKAAADAASEAANKK